MPYRMPHEITRQNLGPFEPNAALDEGDELRTTTRGGIKQFFRNTLDITPGAIRAQTATEFVKEIGVFDHMHPLYHGAPFRYIPPANLEDLGLLPSSERTIKHAIGNMHEMTGRYNADAFAARINGWRKERALQWRAPLDDKFEIRVRGGSGAGTFSIDLGLGVYDPQRPWHYNELWRNGIDSISADGMTGSRFIRTGTGIKSAENGKAEAFDQFRKTYGVLPQRILAILGLYYMRELKPDYALALTTQGAENLSTLAKSKGSCDYTGIFANVGFEPSTDPNWSLIDNFSDGFFAAIEKAHIRRRESDILNIAATSMNNMVAIDSVGTDLELPPAFKICTDSSSTTLERELNAHNLWNRHIYPGRLNR